MRRFFLALCFLVLFKLHAMDMDRSLALLDERGMPTSPLLALLEIFKVEHNGTLEGIVEATQKEWLKPQIERWQIPECPCLQKEAACTLLNQLDCLEEIRAALNNYEGALVLGGYGPIIAARLNFLISEWQRGVRFGKIIFLTGDRPLDPDREKCGNELLTESDLMRFLFNNLSVPEEMKNLPLEVIDIPMQLKQDGSVKKPTTADTLRGWLNGAPKIGQYLALSNQPFIGYQDAVIKTELPPEYSVETIGASADPKLFFSIYLDNIARWLYQEQLRRGNK